MYYNFPLDIDEKKIIQLPNGVRIIYIGEKKVYHATDYNSAQNIIRDRLLKKGTNGMFGPGIYFASSPQIAKQKTLHVHHFANTYVECMVDFGNALILEEPNHNIKLEDITKHGCNSILGRSQIGHKWEFVVYESSRTKPISMTLYSNNNNAQFESNQYNSNDYPQVSYCKGCTITKIEFPDEYRDIINFFRI